MFSIKSQTGNTILMMLVMIAGLSLATIAMFGSAQVYDVSGTRFVNRQKALYISDGTRAFAIQLTQDYLKERPDATNTDVAEYLKIAIPPLLPTGYQVSDISVEMTPKGTMIIPNGTFKGMVAPQVLVKFSYTVSKGVAEAENRISHHFDAVVTLAQVGLHQFMYFVDLQQAGFNPGQETKVNGRVHANGDLCIAGQNGLYFSKITVAGNLMHSRRAACGPNMANFSLLRTYVSAGSSVGDNDKQFGLGIGARPENDHGCTNCDNSGLPWVDYALSNWNQNAQDSTHKVAKLALPVPSEVQAQVGANGPNPYVGVSNSKNLRFLVDPVMPGDSDNVKKMKYAYNADVRIIDGVWYLRDSTNSWPGRPIWSDHPGHAKDAWGTDVGQAQLAIQRGWVTLPKRFSYYGYDPVGFRLQSTTSGTISYGNLARKAAGPRWVPGHLVNTDHADLGLSAKSEFLCPNPAGTAWGTFAPTGGSTTVTGRSVLPFDANSACSPPGSSWSQATALLNGTRSGINDPHVAWWAKIVYEAFPHSSTLPDDRARILPTNFDVENFQAALEDRSAGELGSYFTHNGSKTDFNGILYITTTWPGSLDGFTPRNAPSKWPLQNDGGFTAKVQNSVPPRLGDTNQIGISADEQQRSLPRQLCSNAISDSPAGVAGQDFDRPTLGMGRRFKIPGCNEYASSVPFENNKLWAFPNAIRIHNGANISTTVFKKGLSIVSNMPVYVLGSYNLNSVVTPETSTNWIPALIAGDQITIMSNAWEDQNGPFAISNYPSQAVSRVASSTTYNVSFITGWAMHAPRAARSGETMSASNEGIHSMPALIEDWQAASGGGATMTLNGSIAIGYYPVFYRGGRYFNSVFSGGDNGISSYNYATYNANKKIITYDKHLEQIANQPPGSPVFYTSSVQSWKIK